MNILSKVINFCNRINEFISRKRNYCSSILVLAFTGVNTIFVPMVDYHSGFVVNVYKDAMVSSKAESDEASFRQTFFWTQSVILKGLPQTDERDRALELLSRRHKQAIKDSTINMDYTRPRFDAENAVILSKYGAGVILASIAIATSATVLEKNSLIYTSFLTGCIGLGVTWYANNLCSKLFDKFIYELH